MISGGIEVKLEYVCMITSELENLNLKMIHYL